MRVAGACNAGSQSRRSEPRTSAVTPTPSTWATDLERRVPRYARALTDLGVGELLQQHYG
jgi:hypothetical protein